MKRRYIRIRIMRPPGATGDPEIDARGTTITDLDSRREITDRIPLEYAAPLLGANVGDRIKASIFDHPPRLRYRRHRPGAVSIRRERVLLRVMESGARL